MAENGKWQVAFFLLTVFTVASFSWSTWCFFRNDSKIENLAQVANHSLTNIDKRLCKIEWKLGVE
jgi:hypothetical protein